MSALSLTLLTYQTGITRRRKMAFDLANYETVEVRLERFWEKYPNGRTATRVISETESSITIFGEIFADKTDLNSFSTGIAQESKTNSGVNKDAWVENCETSALGRALANGGFAAKGKRPSREEMEKVQRGETKPVVSDYTPEIIHLAKEALDQVPAILTIEELKMFYTGAKDAGLLSVKINGATLNQIIADRKKELENAK